MANYQPPEIMIVPDRVLNSVFPERRAIDKLLFPRGVPKSISHERQRIVCLVGGGAGHTKKMFQEKIDSLQKEREQWLQMNGTKEDKKEILRDLEMEKLRMGSNRVNSDIVRLRRELAILDEKLKKEIAQEPPPPN